MSPPTPKWQWRAQWTRGALTKERGAPLPFGKSPGAPNSTGSGAGAGRFAAITMLGGSYSQQKNTSLCKTEKGTRPAGCLNNEDTRAALQLPNLSAFLASPRMACQKRVPISVGFQTAVQFCQCGVARLLVAPSAHLATQTKKAALDRGSQVVGSRHLH